MTWQPTDPHNSIKKLPPQIELESKKVLKACIGARVALGELKQAAGLIPNQSMLINIIPMLESKDSSGIENIVTTTDRLFRHVGMSEHADSATKETLLYRTALSHGFQAIQKKPLHINTAIEVCQILKGSEIGIRKTPGTALINQATGQVVYTPPMGETLIRELLSNWEIFMHTHTDQDPLVRLAVGHYQFEAIHPFVDGNGRTGRILNLLFLVEQKLLNLPILYMSKVIIQSKDNYYQLLLEVTKKEAWEPWILYMLDVIEKSAVWTTEKIAGIRALMEHTSEHLKRLDQKLYSHELVAVIFEQPYCRIEHVIKRMDCNRNLASKRLRALVNHGILKEEVHGRDKFFVHPRLMALLQTDDNTVVGY